MLIDATGHHRNTIAAWKRGAWLPRPHDLRAIARAARLPLARVTAALESAREQRRRQKRRPR